MVDTKLLVALDSTTYVQAHPRDLLRSLLLPGGLPLIIDMHANFMVELVPDSLPSGAAPIKDVLTLQISVAMGIK